MNEIKKLIILNKKLLNNIQIDDYFGYDPFDFLNSSIFKASPFRIAICKISMASDWKTLSY